MSSILNFIWHEGAAWCKLSLFLMFVPNNDSSRAFFFLSLKSLKEMTRTI